MILEKDYKINKSLGTLGKMIQGLEKDSSDHLDHFSLELFILG